MSVDGDGRKAWRRCHVAQVLAEAPFVDRQVFRERQQDGRNDAVRHIIGVTRHRNSSAKAVTRWFNDIYHGGTRIWHIPQ